MVVLKEEKKRATDQKEHHYLGNRPWGREVKRLEQELEQSVTMMEAKGRRFQEGRGWSSLYDMFDQQNENWEETTEFNN